MSLIGVLDLPTSLSLANSLAKPKATQAICLDRACDRETDSRSVPGLAGVQNQAGVGAAAATHFHFVLSLTHPAALEVSWIIALASN